MKKLDHPNVVKLVEVLDDPEDDQLYMGNLSFYLSIPIFLSKSSFYLYSYFFLYSYLATVVGDFINIMKTTFDLNF